MKTERWEETHRREVGVMAGDVPHVGASFAILYMVTECRKVRGKAVEQRERLVIGQALHQCAQPLVADAALLEIVAKGVKALSQIARHEDEWSSAAARATSRRRAR